jgi:endonuclease YncB( thermonuclease family)
MTSGLPVERWLLRDRRRGHIIAVVCVIAPVVALWTNRHRPNSDPPDRVAPGELTVRDDLVVTAGGWSIRLAGIEPGGDNPIAAAEARRLCEPGPVHITFSDPVCRDGEGRPLASIYLPDGTMLSERLVERGLVHAGGGGDPSLRDWLGGVERRARQRHIGLWAASGPESDRTHPMN